MTQQTADILRTLGFLIAGIGLFYLFLFLLRRWAKKKENLQAGHVDKHIHASGLTLFVIIVINFALQNFRSYLHPDAYSVVYYILKILLIVVIAHFLTKVVALAKDMRIHHHRKQKYKDYTLRSVRTKLNLIQRVTNIAIIVVAVVAILMTIPWVREVGRTLLASAGVAGIILGFAAQKSLGTLFSGIQIALTQPIKLDDTVNVGGKFGTIGEITLTYVVLNTWDEKRMIIPINYFLENNIENWTRSSPEVVSIVKVYADYMLPIEPIRAEFHKWLENSPHWDKRAGQLVITNADAKSIEIRLTMTARNAADAWELEVSMREKLITHIRENYPDMLPTNRVYVVSRESKG